MVPYSLCCVSCESIVDERVSVTSCSVCGNALDVVYDYPRIRAAINPYALQKTPISATKYLDFYPIIDRTRLVTMDEGTTPLYHTPQLGLPHLYIKDEGSNPTGVFKDRGSMVELTKAVELGATGIVVASTGNMAASVSAYAAKANLPCYVLIPEGTPVGKLSQTMSYGARLLQIRGTYADCCMLSEEMAKTYGFYLAGDFAFRAEGAKSTSYEIIEQLNWRVPDVVVVPVGCGTNLAGMWKGFAEWKDMGFVDKVPRMIAVQPEACPTICQAFREQRERYVYIEQPRTIASAVGIGIPLDDIKALRAIRDSGGDQSTCQERNISEAQRNMARKASLFVEPSGALPIACLPDLIERKIIQDSDLVVCIATGTGLKDPRAAMALATTPPSFEPNIDAVNHYLDHKLYTIHDAPMPDRAERLWNKTPTLKELKQRLRQAYSLKLDKAHLTAIQEECSQFTAKGKAIAAPDLNNIIEEVLNDFALREKTLEVLDFRVETSLNGKAYAWVKARCGTREFEHKAEGVGTVDALVSALRIGIGDELYGTHLIGYEVDIATARTDAVVKVTMTLEDDLKNRVVATTTSPDLVVASLHAFERGYNLLIAKRKSIKKASA